MSRNLIKAILFGSLTILSMVSFMILTTMLYENETELLSNLTGFSALLQSVFFVMTIVYAVKFWREQKAIQVFKMNEPIIKSLEDFTDKVNKGIASELPKSNYSKLESRYKHNFFEAIDLAISKRILFVTSSNIPINKSMLERFSETSIKEVDKIMIENQMSGYGIVEVTRSTNSKIIQGTYFYRIDEKKNLHLMFQPYKIVKKAEDSYFYRIDQMSVKKDEDSYVLFDKKFYDYSITNKAIILYNDIRDFQLFGSQLMQSTVQTLPNNNANTYQPKIVKTLLSESIFGQSYTMLKGMSKMMEQLYNTQNISTIHEIKDAHVVQVILMDNTDIEFKGISIYLDFNRNMGGTKNKESQKTETSNHQLGKIENDLKSQNQDAISQLRELKKMLDEGIIDEVEFTKLKSKIIS